MYRYPQCAAFAIGAEARVTRKGALLWDIQSYWNSGVSTDAAPTPVSLGTQTWRARVDVRGMTPVPTMYQHGVL
ncbi:hypothetical protein BJ508DRAFT_414169 [Ascobolus immersus RN42]|uniref:Uncharacterized protein n=1 Tax=Ascobolus immersus RN42 TaxID=1160509 RepID=A0A3N4IL45_ASCIM|nr:hypothetical protein BJ508DRAFT_414169 [Ascobolus immersus RN42]